MAKRMTRRTSITLSPVLEARLRLMGERLNESRSALVREAILMWLRRVEVQTRQDAVVGSEGAAVS